MEGLLLVKVQQRRRTFASAWKRRYHVFDPETRSLKSYTQDKSELLGELDIVGVLDESSSSRANFMKGKLTRIGTSTKQENRFDVLVSDSDEPYCLAAGIAV
jgi:hypothetical protein